MNIVGYPHISSAAYRSLDVVMEDSSDDEELINATMDISDTSNVLDRQLERSIRIYPEIFPIDDCDSSDSSEDESSSSGSDDSDDYQTRVDNLRESLRRWR